MSDPVLLKPEPLTAAAFAPFGEVIETAGTAPRIINQGFAKRFNDLCKVDVADEGGAVNVSLFTAEPRPRPIAIKLMERHPEGSQAFIPMQNEDWLVLVCAEPRDAVSYRLFSATGTQGVNYAKNVWHHPLLVFSASHFLVIDRKGPGANLEEVWLEQALAIA
ncbi:MAG: ureidoglycolate lyase [Hyphomicrobiales bacterium]